MSDWGPSHQYRRPPRDRKWVPVAVLVLLWLLTWWRFSNGATGFGDALGWGLRCLAAIAVAVLAVRVLWRVARWRRWSSSGLVERLADRPAARIGGDGSPGEAARAQCARHGGGAFLGFGPGGRWVGADAEHAVMVLGPPRSGKTSSIVIPSLLACPGAAVSTSTKPDVLRATARARGEVGELWLFDPTGTTDPGLGARRLCWSPVAAARSWDGALVMARAMAACSSVGKGTTHESHWTERSAALLAPLLHAACLDGRAITDVLRWVLRQDLDSASVILEDRGAEVAGDVLVGIASTEERERSSIFSATAGVLGAYNSDSARAAAKDPNFDVPAFVGSSDTVYITAPAHRQGLVAPLVVGLLEEIRYATYERHRQGGLGPPVFFCLDEVANIAPIHDLPALASEAGGQGLHLLCCLQDLSQARLRWGDQAADGFASLFQTKVILSGIADPRTLEGISLALGEYDRQLVSHTVGLSHTGMTGPGTASESVSYSTQRQRTLSPGEIARLPAGHALLLQGVSWGLVRLTPWHRTAPWDAVARAGSPALPASARSERFARAMVLDAGGSIVHPVIKQREGVS